jgi:hypothetical protein
MSKRLRLLYAIVTAAGLILAAGRVWADPKDKPNNPHGQQDKAHGQGNAKSHKHVSGKNLLGDKIKQNGHHKLQDNGKFSAYADVANGKVTGVKVTHADKGDVPVTKYKSTKKMASRELGKAQIYLAQYGYDDSTTTVWIGYAYIDDYGDEIIYWFPVEMVADGDAGCVPYDDYYNGY